MKARELARELIRQGAVLERKDGDHLVFMLPSGRQLILPFGGKHSDVKSYVIAKIRRLWPEWSPP